MIKELIKIANELDKRKLFKESNELASFGKMYVLSNAISSGPSKARTILRKKKD